MSSELPTQIAARQDLAEAHRRTEALAFFARRMAHDLSNFLTVIRTYSELMLGDLPSDHPSRADLMEIAQAADTTVAYVQRSSSFGRAANGKAAPLLLDALVRDVVQQAEQAGHGPIMLSLACGATVSGSAAVLAEAITELLVNAREASPAASPVVVRSRVESTPEAVVDAGVPINPGTWAIMEIIDRGPGIAESVAATMFDPFVTSKSGVRGAGFGLTIARSAAWAGGGELTLSHVDGITVARLYLPVVTNDSASA
jgi:signal transduction histidine kinase